MSLKRSRETDFKARGEDGDEEPQAKKTNTVNADGKWAGSADQLKTIVDSMRSSIGILPELSRIVGDYADLWPIRIELIAGTPCWLNKSNHTGLMADSHLPGDPEPRWYIRSSREDSKIQNGSMMKQDEKGCWHNTNLYDLSAINKDRTCLIQGPKMIDVLRLERPLTESVRRWKWTLECQTVRGGYTPIVDISVFVIQVYLLPEECRVGTFVEPLASDSVPGWPIWNDYGVASHPTIFGTFYATARNNRVVLDVTSNSDGIRFSVEGTTSSVYLPGDFSAENFQFVLRSSNWRMLCSFDPSISFANVYTL
jgi:hypothetical protein